MVDKQAAVLRLISYTSLAGRGAGTAIRVFTEFLACMGLLLWAADAPATWAALWGPGISLWAIGQLLKLIVRRRL